jgi:hypothetical protein
MHKYEYSDKITKEIIDKEISFALENLPVLEDYENLEEKYKDHITISNVKSIYKLTEKDLENVEYITKRNPYYRNASDMILYNRKTIRELHARKKFNLELSQFLSYQERILKLVEKLKKIGISYEDIKNDSLVCISLENYTQKEIQKPNISITEVVSRIKSINSINTFLPDYCKKASLVPYFKNFKGTKKDAIKLVNSTLKKFSTARKVLYNFDLSSKIASFVGETSTFVSVYPELKDIFVYYENKENIMREIKNTIKKDWKEWKYWGSDVKEYKEVDLNIYPFCEFVENAQKYPSNRYFGINACIRNINDVLKNNNQERKHNLQRLLNVYGIQIRDDSKLCRAYIEGSCGKSIKHVVSIVRITNHLWENGEFQAFGKYAQNFEQKLVNRLLKGLTFEEATEEILELCITLSRRGHGYW